MEIRLYEGYFSEYVRNFLFRRDSVVCLWNIHPFFVCGCDKFNFPSLGDKPPTLVGNVGL